MSGYPIESYWTAEVYSKSDFSEGIQLKTETTYTETINVKVTREMYGLRPQ